MEALATAPAPSRPGLPPPTRCSHLLRPKALTTSKLPRRVIAALHMDGACAAPLCCTPAETDAAATTSDQTETVVEATEQGNNGAPAADAPAASIEGLDGIKIRRRPVTGPSGHHVGPFQFRLENVGNTPRNILEKIVWNKDVEIWQMKEKMPLYRLKGLLDNAPPARDFVAALKASYDRTAVPALIAEVKKASPSQGVLRLIVSSLGDLDPYFHMLWSYLYRRYLASFDMQPGKFRLLGGYTQCWSKELIC
ncbi:uncharacterized protein [Aegilops tauschii subsp. strangulata]|uniref:uncharacterized protein isoform X2 n=1 Tax=Aegilops tauschii subsp. strangulata TaxID=200361 RepID=UPI00098A3F57|nr:uncharacterized protein LOC109750962 isoform X2 [Aegilops tauschii subsp. strangulata]